METQQAWRMRLRFSYRNATIVVCFFNLVTALLLLQRFLNAVTTKSTPSHHPDPALLQYIRESEEIRRTMAPLDLIKRVKEIEQEAYMEQETVPQTVPKKTTAVDLSKKLDDFRAMNDAKNQKALEEWRMRKIERARQRESHRDRTKS